MTLFAFSLLPAVVVMELTFSDASDIVHLLRENGVMLGFMAGAVAFALRSVRNYFGAKWDAAEKRDQEREQRDDRWRRDLGKRLDRMDDWIKEARDNSIQAVALAERAVTTTEAQRADLNRVLEKVDGRLSAVEVEVARISGALEILQRGKGTA